MLASVSAVRFLAGTVASIRNFVDGEHGPATAGVREYLFQQGIAEWCLARIGVSHGPQFGGGQLPNSVANFFAEN